MCINPNYIVDNKNHKIAVQLDINTYNQMTETLENFALYKLMEMEIEDDKNNETLSLNDAKEYYKSLKQNK
jgi:hypothetical protein